MKVVMCILLYLLIGLVIALQFGKPAETPMAIVILVAPVALIAALIDVIWDAFTGKKDETEGQCISCKFRKTDHDYGIDRCSLDAPGMYGKEEAPCQFYEREEK